MADDDDLDGCEIDFSIDPDDEETESLRPLFPDGDSAREQEWRDLFERDRADGS